MIRPGDGCYSGKLGTVVRWMFRAKNGGLPVGYVALRVSQNEAQRRSLWSTTQTYVKSDAPVVPEPDEGSKVFGAGRIDNIPFRALSIYATDDGIRLERPFGEVKFPDCVI